MLPYLDYKYRPRKKAKGAQNSTDLTVQQQQLNNNQSVSDQQSQNSTGSANSLSSSTNSSSASTSSTSSLELMDCTSVNNVINCNNIINCNNSTKLSINCGMIGKLNNSSTAKQSRININNQGGNLHLLNPSSKIKFKLIDRSKDNSSITKKNLPISFKHLTASNQPIKLSDSSSTTTVSSLDLPESPESASSGLSFYDDGNQTLTNTSLSNTSASTNLNSTAILNNKKIPSLNTVNKNQFNNLNLLLSNQSTVNSTTTINNTSASTLLGLSLQPGEICNENDLSEFIGDELSLSSELNQCSSSNSPIEFQLNLLNSNNHLNNLDHSNLMRGVGNSAVDEDQFSANCQSNALIESSSEQNGSQTQQINSNGNTNLNSNNSNLIESNKLSQQNDQSMINQFLISATQSDQLINSPVDNVNVVNGNTSLATTINSNLANKILNTSSTLIYTPEHSLASNSSGSNHINNLVNSAGLTFSNIHELDDLQDVLQIENSWAMNEFNNCNLTPISDLDCLETASSSSGSHFEFPDYHSPEVSDILGEDWVDLGLKS